MARVAPLPRRGRSLQPPTEKSPRASPRSRQQRRSGAPRLEEENAARRGISRNEAAPQLREAVGAARARKGRSGAPLPQAPAQANGARRLLSLPRAGEPPRFPRKYDSSLPPGRPDARGSSASLVTADRPEEQR